MLFPIPENDKLKQILLVLSLPIASSLIVFKLVVSGAPDDGEALETEKGGMLTAKVLDALGERVSFLRVALLMYLLI
jgi:hypothetical protein